MLNKYYIIPILRYVLVVSFLLLMSACQKKVERQIGETCYNLGESSIGNLNDIFQDVEIIPLQFEGEYYPPNAKQVVVSDSVILVSDNRNRIYVFNSDGTYVSSSNEHYGMGPEDISMVSGWTWNPYSKRIEILTSKALSIFSRNFSFETTIPLPGSEGVIYDQIFDISESEHFLVPTGMSPKSHGIFKFDSNTSSLKEIYSYEDNVIAPVSMQWQSFFIDSNGGILFSPPAVTYTIYNLESNGKVTADISFIPGTDWLTKNKRSEYTSDRQFAEYLMTSSDYIPIRTLITGKYIFTLAKKGRKLSDMYYFVTNRLTKDTQAFELYNEGNYSFPMLSYACNEYIYAVMDKESIEATPQLLLGSEEACNNLAATDSETLVLLKYKTSNN